MLPPLRLTLCLSTSAALTGDSRGLNLGAVQMRVPSFTSWSGSPNGTADITNPGYHVLMTYRDRDPS